MPKLGRTTPCAKCPWLKKSLAGWLGEDNPLHFYQSAVSGEGNHPCHDQIDYSEPNWIQNQLPFVDFCAGNLIFFANHMKMPRDPGMAAAVRAVETSPHVFSWAPEFLAHHLKREPTPEEIMQANYPPFQQETL